MGSQVLADLDVNVYLYVTKLLRTNKSIHTNDFEALFNYDALGRCYLLAHHKSWSYFVFLVLFRTF